MHIPKFITDGLYKEYKEHKYKQGLTSDVPKDFNGITKSQQTSGYTTDLKLDCIMIRENYKTGVDSTKLRTDEARFLVHRIDLYETKIKDFLYHNNYNNFPHDIVDVFNKHLDHCVTVLVGGSVRDILLDDQEPKDFDFATSCNIDQVVSTFHDLGYKVDTVGKQFLVVIVKSKNGESVEIAQFRRDDKESDGRRPRTVYPGTAEQDALRRDFTVNSLMFDIKIKKLRDYTNGVQDIISETLRFIGNPKDRINEDALRVFRFYRLLSTKKLIADPKSLRSVRQHFSHAHKVTNPTRIMNELERMI